MAGVGTVIVTWRWAHDALASNVGGIVAGLLVALSPALIINSRDARMYSLETFFTTTAWWLIWMLITGSADWSSRRRIAVSAALVVAVAGQIWTLSLGVPSAGLQLAFTLVASAWLRNRQSVVAVGCILVGSASLVPWLPSLLRVALNGQAFWTPRPDLTSISSTFKGWLVGESGGLVPIAIAFAAVLITVGLAAALLEQLPPQEGRAPERGQLLGLALILDFALMPSLWIYSQFHSIYDPRYLGPSLPPLAISIAAAVVVLGGWLRTRAGFSRRLTHGLSAALLVLPIVIPMGMGAVHAVDGSRSDANVEPGRQMERQLTALVRPGDIVIALNPQTYFPSRYYLNATGDADRLNLKLYYWHRPTAAFYTGWEDIDGRSVVDPPRVSILGWRGAVGLRSGAELWLVSLVNPNFEFKAFDQLDPKGLRVLQTLYVSGGSVLAQIREAVPAG